ncbi:MAG: hypothetical protein DRH03_12375, partial [Deltaproteobacteria bacterium]
MTIVAEWLIMMFLGITLVLMIFIWRIVTLANRRLMDSFAEQLRQSRREFVDDLHLLREELARSQRDVGDSLVRTISEIG